MNLHTMLVPVLLVIVNISGCASGKFEPFQPEPVNFEKTEPYKVDVSKLDDVLKSAVEKQYLATPAIIHEDGKVELLPENSPKKATHVVLLPEDYQQVANIADVAMAYRDTTLAQESLINAHISTINSLKEMVELERQKLLIYRNAWVDSENMYRNERKLHRRDNFINDAKMLLVTIGSIAGFAMAL